VAVVLAAWESSRPLDRYSDFGSGSPLALHPDQHSPNRLLTAMIDIAVLDIIKRKECLLPFFRFDYESGVRPSSGTSDSSHSMVRPIRRLKRLVYEINKLISFRIEGIAPPGDNLL